MRVYKQRLEVGETTSYVEKHPRKRQQLVQIPWDGGLPVVFKNSREDSVTVRWMRRGLKTRNFWARLELYVCVVCVCVCVCVSHSVMSNSLWPHALQPARLLCPWNSPGKNTGVGCHFLLQCEFYFFVVVVVIQNSDFIFIFIFFTLQHWFCHTSNF